MKVLLNLPIIYIRILGKVMLNILGDFNLIIKFYGGIWMKNFNPSRYKSRFMSENRRDLWAL